MAKTSRQSPKFMLRLPDELLAGLRAAAEASGRSVTAEIVSRLEASFFDEDQMATERTPMANIPPFGLRMQPSLKAKTEEEARRNNRSLNAEIVSLIEEALSAREKAKGEN